MELAQNDPNPFNLVTTLRFDLPERAEVALTIYDILGREVVRLINQEMGPGYHQVVWDGVTTRGWEVPSGIYIARLSIIPPTAGVTPVHSKSIKMLLSRCRRGCY